ncbi:hypothetical protein [Xanthomonas euvesicatoria]|uniref:hypothetical protein n=1 Tax=Xanthomonas euvesicatoria TaxID=456327 RepID=UPI0010ACC36F|nr:hypothetical protein [Xanthomonas euvesicatoria]
MERIAATECCPLDLKAENLQTCLHRRSKDSARRSNGQVGDNQPALHLVMLIAVSENNPRATRSRVGLRLPMQLPT